jgi:hypothetical protein
MKNARATRWTLTLGPGFRLFLLLLLTAAAAYPAARAADLSAADQQFMAGYIHIHDALIADDLKGAIKAANTLPDNSGAVLAQAASLNAARDEFSKLTPRAEKLAAGQTGYHVFYCPMAKKNWVQAGAAVANPYMGPQMLTCGVEKK